MVENEDTFRILIVTDTHLGYKEDDAIRCMDSFNTFEEILQIAEAEKVDFLLHCGDLFHHNKPSRSTIYKTVSLLRKYCIGPSQVNFRLISNPAIFNNGEGFGPNYIDNSIDVKIPIFSINGNHDDPSGISKLGPMDFLGAIGLVNYYGKHESVRELSVDPLLFQKGDTRIGIYGHGYIKEERLFHMHKNNKYTFNEPVESAASYFNIFTLHQNRAKHSSCSYFAEKFLPDFTDLVIWGHEHECLIEPESSFNGKYFVVQPGSSVATSLAAGEAVIKHVGMLSVCGKQFKIEPIPLRTVRPFVFDEICLSLTSFNPEQEDLIRQYLIERVFSNIEKSTEQISGHLMQPILPLIRIRVSSSGGYVPIKNSRFGCTFIDKVANVSDILLFKDEKKHPKDTACSNAYLPSEATLNMSCYANIDDIIEKHFVDNQKSTSLDILSQKHLRFLLDDFINKGEKDALTIGIENYFEYVHSKIKNSSNFENLSYQIEVAQRTVEDNCHECCDMFGNKVELKTESQALENDKVLSEISDNNPTMADASKVGRKRITKDLQIFPASIRKKDSKSKKF